MLNLVLTERSGAAAAARRALIDRNGELPATVRDDVLLLVSELVSNAVVHAGCRTRTTAGGAASEGATLGCRDGVRRGARVHVAPESWRRWHCDE